MFITSEAFIAHQKKCEHLKKTNEVLLCSQINENGILTNKLNMILERLNELKKYAEILIVSESTQRKHIDIILSKLNFDITMELKLNLKDGLRRRDSAD